MHVSIKKMVASLIGLVLCLACLLSVSFLLFGENAVQAADPTSVKRFHLYATDGYMTMPDGKQIYIWGYSLQNEQGTAVYPAPKLEVTEGDKVEVTLTNIGPKKDGIRRVAHTIHFHGLDTDQANDGVPHTSAPIQVGESFTYHFTAANAGTYFYHCHVDTVEHLQMGMFGAFIVKAKDGNKAWTGGPAYDSEYAFVLNEIDPVWHKAVEDGESYDRTAFHPRYWTINGKAFPDTENDPDSRIEGKVGETLLIRVINAGYEAHSFHMHGHHFKVIASDGRPLPEPIEKDTVNIGPGERYDLLVTFTQSGMYPFHSHYIVDNTNDGVYPGGLHTMIDIAPADGDIGDVIPGTDPIHDHNRSGSDTQMDNPVSGTEQAMGKRIMIKAGESFATVNGETVEVTPAPVIIGGATFVPLRFIGNQFEASMKWIGPERSVLYTTANTQIQLWIGKRTALVNGKEVTLDQPPQMVGDSSMVPLRFVSEELGAKVSYDSVTRVITLQYEADVSMGTDQEMNHASDMPGNESDVSMDPVEGEVVVMIQNSVYSVKELQIKKGTTVTWINQDTMIHTVTDLGNRFDSGNMTEKGKWSYTFNQPGTYTYYCTLHPSMIAKVTVSEK